MSAALVPTFTRHLTLHGQDDAWRLANNVLNTLLLVTGDPGPRGDRVRTGVCRAPTLATSPRSRKIELTVQLTRVVLPFLTVVAVAAAMMGMLNSLHHYFVPALSPATFNIATIVVRARPRAGDAARSAGRDHGGRDLASSAASGKSHAQWLPLRREGFRTRRGSIRRSRLRQVLLLMGPGTIGLAATQVNIFVSTLLATSQGTGAVSWLTYAFRLVYLPIGLFGVSIATAVLPAVSRDAARGDEAGIRTTVSRGIGLMLMLNVPATLGLIALATPIVRLLFEHGQFLPADTAPRRQHFGFTRWGWSATRRADRIADLLRARTEPGAGGRQAMADRAQHRLSASCWFEGSGSVVLPLGTSVAALANGRQFWSVAAPTARRPRRAAARP